MKRIAGAMVLTAALGGCVATESGPSAGSGGVGCGGHCGVGPSVPGVQGPWGQPVAMIAPYSVNPPGAEAAKAMMARSVPMDLVQQAGYQSTPGAPSGIMLAGGQGAISPAGAPFQPINPGAGDPPPPGAVAAVGALTGQAGSRFPTRRTEVRFVGPRGMKVSWYAAAPGSTTGFASNHIDVPGRYNFVQAAIYRLKISDIPARPGVELYPTLEVVPSNGRSDPFLAHSAVPVAFTDEDFEQVAAGNFVVKVIYLPDPQYQDLATIGPDEVVSTRLEPGVDPIAEAHRRGNILLIVRLGNIDLEAPNTPAMDAPNPYAPNCPPGMQAGMRMPPGMQMPPGMPLPPGMAMPNPMAGGRPSGVPMPAGAMPGRGPMPMLPPGAMMNPAGMPANGGPVSKLPDAQTLQQMKYQGQPTDMPASVKASESDAKDSSDKKPAKSRQWWQVGSDK